MTASRPITPQSSATIATIAEEVGVSVATVSKVLNGRADVAAETRARVEESLERHRYRRRIRRQSLGIDQIDVVFHEFNSGWAMEIMSGVEAVATAAGLGIAISQLDGEHRPAPRRLDALIARRPLGLLFVLCHPTPPQQLLLTEHRIPFVVVDTDSATSASVPTVGSNNWNGGLLATRHLMELGHRRIAVISGPRDVLCSQARAAGFRSAHDEVGLTLDADLVRYGNFYVDGGLRARAGAADRARPAHRDLRRLDLQAIGVLRAARQLGLRVPEDLSVIGYDDLPVAGWTDPPLTTVHQPLRDMAGTATQMLLELARGGTVATSRIDLVTELVVRESTAPPTTNRP